MCERAMVKAAKYARNRRLFKLWIACHRQEEIAEREDIMRQAKAVLYHQWASPQFCAALASTCKGTASCRSGCGASAMTLHTTSIVSSTS